MKLVMLSVVKMASHDAIAIFFVNLLFISSGYSEEKETLQSEFIDRFTLLAGDTLLESTNGSNVIFSPFNIFHSFSLLHIGSSEKTREELSSIFGFPENPENATSYHEKFSQSIRTLHAMKDATAAATVGIFAGKDLKLKSSFEDKVKSIYNASVQHVDFSNGSTTEYVNKWIANRTKDHIKNYFTYPINAGTDLRIVSALYFSANWKSGFDKTMTQKGDFHTGYSTLKVDMMSELNRLEYGDDPKYPFRILGLPYKNEDIYFYIQLPRANPSSANFACNFSAIYLTTQEILQSLKPNLVHVKLPRFSLNSTFNLQKVLKKFGATRILEEPQLAGMADGVQIKSLEVNHGVSIDVDESGSAAASVSSVSLIPMSASIPEIPKDFYVDKPFTFFIYSKSLKTILFAGAVSRIES